MNGRLLFRPIQNSPISGSRMYDKNKRHTAKAQLVIWTSSGKDFFDSKLSDSFPRKKRIIKIQKKMPEKRWIPQVLWRLFGNRARTLASAIVALLPYPPPSPAECPCKGLRCLGCSGSDAMSFLLRPEDPDDYLKLLNRCFIVVPDDEPALSYFHPHCRWSQAQVCMPISLFIFIHMYWVMLYVSIHISLCVCVETDRL